jgi:formylglycine-generating enzyme required for sulfatase activity
MSADEILEAISPQLEEKKGGMGAVIAIAVLVLLAALAAGGYFLFAGDEAPAPVPPAQPEPAAPSAPEPTEPLAPVPAVPPTPTPVPQPEPVVQPTPVQPAPGADGGLRVFRDALASGGEAPEMVMLPGGSFQMGVKAFAGDSDELPRHTRRVAAFAMSRHEVTIDEYQRFARATSRRMPDLSGLDPDSTPIVYVSWDDANAYALWLSKETGEKYRLPSEAQWEYAARAGTDTPYWWGFDLGENRAHCFDCKTGLNPRQPTRTGRFEPNAFGLHDTAGNVMEWTRDCYHKNYNGAPEDASAWEGGDCRVRVVRGGSYANIGKSLRSAARAKRSAQSGNDETGIRLVRDP